MMPDEACAMITTLQAEAFGGSDWETFLRLAEHSCDSSRILGLAAPKSREIDFDATLSFRGTSARSQVRAERYALTSTRRGIPCSTARRSLKARPAIFNGRSFHFEKPVRPLSLLFLPRVGFISILVLLAVLAARISPL